MQLLDALPGEVLELILGKLDNTEDLRSCSLAHPRLDAELQRWKCLYLMQQVLPFIMQQLSVKDALKIPDVCTHWRDAAKNYEKNVPGKLPYEEEPHVKQMETYKRDLSEDKIFKDSWFLTFKNLGPDLRAFQREIAASPDKLPFNVGRSIHLLIEHSNWKVREMYLHKLFHFLALFGDYFRYVKVSLSGSVEGGPAKQSFIRFLMLLSHIPSVRVLHLHASFIYPGGAALPIPLPELPELETISLSTHPSLQQLEKHVIYKYVSQLRKVEISAIPRSLAEVMPCLVDLHLRDIKSDHIFQDLKLLDAPLQKLKLHFRESVDYTCAVLMILKSTAHLPIQQMILKFDNQSVRDVDFSKFRSPTLFSDFQFPHLHTLTLHNCPEPWYPFMICFPNIRYFYIRDTMHSKELINMHREMSRKEEYFIAKLLGRISPSVEPSFQRSEFENFHALKHVSVEIWEGYPYSVHPVKKVYSRLWSKQKPCIRFEQKPF